MEVIQDSHKSAGLITPSYYDPLVTINDSDRHSDMHISLSLVCSYMRQRRGNIAGREDKLVKVSDVCGNDIGLDAIR